MALDPGQTWGCFESRLLTGSYLSRLPPWFLAERGRGAQAGLQSKVCGGCPGSGCHLSGSCGPVGDRP